MKLETWRLTGSRFHFGERGLGQEATRAFWSSDSLFAALVARLAWLGGAQAVDIWMQPFLNHTPPFLLTSLFPFVGNVRFFPVPLAALLPDGQPLPKGVRPKDLKKVQFVSECLYRQLLEGKSLVDVETGSHKLQEGKVWLAKHEYDGLRKELGQDFQLWHIAKRPRVTVERASNASTLFHVGAVQFSPACGLWFGVQWLDPSADTALFTNLLYDLSQAGLGAERSVGYGQGTFKPSQPLIFPDPQHLWTSLSRYLPRQQEMDAFQNTHAAWKVETVGGWLASPQKRGQRRRTINLVQEGATLGCPNAAPPFGRVADVRPHYRNGPEAYPVKHPVYRSGLAVAVGYGGGQ